MAKKTDLNDQVKIRGIRKRWLLNSIGVVLLILALALGSFFAALWNYYYSSTANDLTGRASSAAGSFRSYTRTQEMDKVTGLMTGADDYVTKPFSPAELTARVDALYRRTGGDTESLSADEISDPPFLLNTRNRTLEKNGQRVKLTQVEYAIMRVFMENPGKALSREEILDRVWGRDYFGELKIVDVNIRRLRLKIEDNVQNPTFITTVWGYGYKWDA